MIITSAWDPPARTFWPNELSCLRFPMPNISIISIPGNNTKITVRTAKVERRGYDSDAKTTRRGFFGKRQRSGSCHQLKNGEEEDVAVAQKAYSSYADI